MAYSPNRKTYAFPTRRQENSNQLNFNQNSPTVRSPRLNDESDYTNPKDPNTVHELKTKLEIVLRHNSHLLNENATLSEMVNSLRIQLDLKANKQEAQVLKANNQLKTTINELKTQQQLHERELQRLLDEISRLHEDCYRIETDKNGQIKRLQESHEKQMTVQIRNLKKSTQDGKQIVELQIKKLKENIELKNFEYQSLKSQSKSEIEKLRNENSDLRNENKHNAHLKQIEMKELINNNKQSLQTLAKQMERENMIELSKRENKIKKLKQEVIDKNIQIQQTHKKSSTNTEEYQNQISNLRSEKQRLLDEISQIENETKAYFDKEKRRLLEVNELEKENLQNIAKNERECLKGQIDKLMTVCLSKTEEIKKLYEIISEIKSANFLEKKELQKIIDGLRKKIKQFQEDSLQEMEVLKVKMGKLHQADISSLEHYYENQIASLSTQIKELSSQRDLDREKIHKLLQDNDELRKTFEIQLTKYKAKVQDYKVKFAAANLEFREQITSLGTKMDLTSQTLLREAEQKQKGAEFFESEKKKFYALIESKDREITNLYQNMERQKNLHGEEVEQMRAEIRQVKDKLQDKLAEMKQFKKSLEQEFERKSEKLISDSKADPDDLLTRQNVELRGKIEDLQKELFQKGKQIEHLQRQTKSLQQQVGLRAGFLETMQLQSSAALEDEKSKLKVLMGDNEVAMKDYYESKLGSREKDNQNLKKQLAEKETDLRALLKKYKQLEKKLNQLLQAQDKLSVFQEKVVNLGLDQNLVKNMAELFLKHKEN